MCCFFFTGDVDAALQLLLSNWVNKANDDSTTTTITINNKPRKQNKTNKNINRKYFPMPSGGKKTKTTWDWLWTVLQKIIIATKTEQQQRKITVKRKCIIYHHNKSFAVCTVTIHVVKIEKEMPQWHLFKKSNEHSKKIVILPAHIAHGTRIIR